MGVHHHPVNADAMFLEQTQQLTPGEVVANHPHHLDRHAQVDQHFGHSGRPPEG